MDSIVKKLQKIIPGIVIIPGETLRWSPKTKEITYPADETNDETLWGLLHEAGHAKLGHTNYTLDIDLLIHEVAAWEEAVALGNKLNILINTEHIQDCLDTYRDWLHQRSTCPRCGIVSFQENFSTYRCFNCRNSWTVSQSRLCRPYRLNSTSNKNRPGPKSQAVFQARRTA